jgi:PPOX class probable F420-dependent enzyme
MPGYGLEGAASAPGERLPWSRVSELIAGARNYWIATARPDGRPHAVPVWGVWIDGVFYFSTGLRSRKARNIAANPQVALHIESGDAAIVLEGRAEQIDLDEALARFVEPYEEKYEWHPKVGTGGWAEFLRRSAVYAVRPRTALSFTEDLPETATRWRFTED